MSANTSPVFAITPYLARAEITATTTDKTGATTGNLVQLLQAGGNGSKISQIGCKVEGTSAAGLLLIFITDSSGNISTVKLFDEIVLSLVTTSNTQSTFRAFNAYSDLELTAGQKIYVGVTLMTANVMVWAQQGDF
jgi:hypothetical protein